MPRRKKPTTIPEVESPESQVSQARAEAVSTGARAHNHFCEVCKSAVAHCGAEGPCQHEGPQYCSAHVPIEYHHDPDHPYFGTRVEDKPTVRMHVKIAE